MRSRIHNSGNTHSPKPNKKILDSPAMGWSQRRAPSRRYTQWHSSSYEDLNFESNPLNKLILRPNILGFEVLKNEVPVTLYRAREELPKSDSPKPCFAPIYTPSGQLITEYRPTDHTWHTGLYFGWVHANDTNLWGGPWYIESSGKYEHVANSHGIQRHDRFTKLANSSPIRVSEQLTWLDGVNHPIAQETRNYTI